MPASSFAGKFPLLTEIQKRLRVSHAYAAISSREGEVT